MVRILDVKQNVCIQNKYIGDPKDASKKLYNG